MKKFFILLLLLPIILLRCESKEISTYNGPRCFQQHLEDAIVKNKIRKDRYSTWAQTVDNITPEQTQYVSQYLISLEKASLPVGDIIDRQARPWQETGIDIVCHEFVSMDLAPDYDETLKIPAYNHESQQGKNFASDIVNAYQSNGFEGVSSELETILAYLNGSIDPDKRYNCMLRHTMESLLRISNKAPEHIEKSQSLNMQSTSDFSWTLIQLHLIGLDKAIYLDELAAPIQKAGIPIICQDVPVITPY